MLVLTRKPCQKLLVGNDVTVTILKVRGNQVSIGIEAPACMRILREELGILTLKQARATLRRGICGSKSVAIT
jgi:carbon storage regulator CsrA